MTLPDSSPSVPFEVNDWLIDAHNPAQQGQFTGRTSMAGPRVMVELRYPDGALRRRPLEALSSAKTAVGGSIPEKLLAGQFGRVRDLQRLITFEKLRGTLHEVVYSMEAAQIDFYPYQFKPVLKFINSPTQRLIIADEVGLGKTIESALIWMELQARSEARRLLVVCPKILTEKWKEELRTKFLFDARIVDFRDLQGEIAELKRNGPTHPFVLIAAYTGLRPPRKEIKLLTLPPDEGGGSAKTQFLQDVRHWPYTYPPFDLVIYDEAHYLRNAGTSTFHLGDGLASHNETGVLCVSATPVNNSNNDLHTLLRLIDSDFFETQGMFEELLEANRPTVQTQNTLSRPKIDWPQLETGVAGMAKSGFINDSPLFNHLLTCLGHLEESPENRTLVARAQDTVEKLNLLGNYVNRTRRVQVEEKRPIRRAVVLPVEYTESEAILYKAILKLVRAKCARDSRPFHVFQVLGLQLRAASCLPVIADDIAQGRLLKTQGSSLEEMAELLSESIGEEVFDGFESLVGEQDEFADVDLKEVLQYDFEGNDRKFGKLLELLGGTAMDENRERISVDEKVVIFAYYRPTLAYLNRRLRQAGYSIATIHGGVDHEQRWVELARFKDHQGPRILLSSEVGSEGIDLQFCRIVVNYDLPWNPMRIEQRIGRIDRVNQKADTLLIVNFKVKGTVEERLYDRLHAKLLVFANSLGDLESVIGEEVQSLTLELLSQNLTPEEEEARMDLAENVIASRVRLIAELEESGDSMVALNDYVQKKIREDREMGRYILAEELEDYLSDFFEREFKGSEILHNTPAPHCFRLRLSQEARASLSDFIREDHSLSARPLRQREISITFRREIHAALPATEQKAVYFVNHLSPLVRWITQHNRDRSHAFYKVSALQLHHEDLPPGDYCYRIERWVLKGLTTRETLAYAVTALSADGTGLEADQAEQAMQEVLRKGKDWDYVDCDTKLLADTHEVLSTVLEDRFNEAYKAFDAENKTTVQIRMKRAENHWDRLISQSEKAIQTMTQSGQKESLIRGRETRLRNERQNKDERLTELGKGSEVEPDPSEVAAGVFRILGPTEPH
jgi:SNF2 family DNA or RNA helicase